MSNLFNDYQRSRHYQIVNAINIEHHFKGLMGQLNCLTYGDQEERINFIQDVIDDFTQDSSLHERAVAFAIINYVKSIRETNKRCELAAAEAAKES